MIDIARAIFRAYFYILVVPGLLVFLDIADIFIDFINPRGYTRRLD